MKKLIHLSSLLVAALFLCFSQKASATHFQGGDLTYSIIAPNIYLVTAKVYRDCTGAAAYTYNDLKVWSPGCNAGRTIAMTMQPGLVTGTPYCASAGNPCNTSGRPNYQEVTFTAVVTFTAAEQACTDWIFSTRNSARNTNENIVGQGYIYTEAFVKLRPSTASTVEFYNTSPQFAQGNIPIPIVCFGQQTRFSLNANEPDGDSLSYELVAAESDYNTPIAYKPNTAVGLNGLIQNPNPKLPFDNTLFNGQFAQVQGTMPANFSPAYPMPSVVVNWNGPATIPLPGAPHGGKIWAATPSFVLNPLSGELSFTPSAYHANTAPNLGRNKYVVVVQINEWRKVNGIMTKVGYIRRDMLFIVENCADNISSSPDLPTPPPIFGTSITGDSIIDVQTCNSTPLRFYFRDQNSGDNLTVTFDSTVIKSMPNSYLQIFNNGTDSVDAILYITPEPGDAGKNYYLPITVVDDHCPIKGTQSYIYRIHVVDNNFAKPEGGEQERFICLGEGTDLNVTLLRPDSLLLRPATIPSSAVYSYQWSLAAGTNPATAGFNSATSTNQNISVLPTAVGEYRYNLRINSSLIGCFDTISFAIKVLPLPLINNIKVSYLPNTSEIAFGRSAPLLVDLGNGSTAGYTYSWSPAKGLSDSTILNPVASPSQTTEYNLTVTTPEGECQSRKTVTVKVAPFFLPNIITPNNDNKNDVFLFKGVQPNTSLKIYNRWGVLIKEYSSYDNSFDGKGVADGTYFYIAQEPNGGKTYKGWFDIVRK